MAAGPNDLVTLAQAYAWLGITPNSDDINLQFAISAYSQLIASWCSRNFVVASYSETYDGHGETRLLLGNFPIISVSSLTIDGNAVTAAPNPLGRGYVFDGRSISVIGGLSFTRGLQNVAISYTAGLNPIPADLQMACLEWMKAAYLQRDQSNNLLSHRAGDTEEKFMPGGAVTMLGKEAAAMPASVYAVLSQYRNTLPV